ncbi:hypothetical protein ACRAWF_07565 [Streptomyces sp. L7]
MLHQLVTLLSGGTAPLTASIGTSAALYLSDDDWPSGLPVEDAVVKTLWNYAPIANYAAHYPTQDVELGERTLHTGDPVLISFAAANNDPKLTAHREQLKLQGPSRLRRGPARVPGQGPGVHDRGHGRRVPAQPAARRRDARPLQGTRLGAGTVEPSAGDRTDPLHPRTVPSAAKLPPGAAGSAQVAPSPAAMPQQAGFSRPSHAAPKPKGGMFPAASGPG